MVVATTTPSASSLATAYATCKAGASTFATTCACAKTTTAIFAPNAASHRRFCGLHYPWCASEDNGAEYRQHALCGFLEEVSARLELFVSLFIFHVVKFFSLPLQNSRSKALIMMCEGKIQEKTWESLLLAYPTVRLSHCLSLRIGNAVSPRRDILRTAMAAVQPWGYNTSHVDVPVAVPSERV